MPFTLTHTLAVVPLAGRSRTLPPAALFIGAMLPDWSLFVPLGPHYTTMHTIGGLFTACIPMGLVLFVLFRSLYRRAAVELLPAALQARLSPFKHCQTSFSARELMLAAAAIGIGAATHLFWDAFTHQGRWGVAAIPLLSQVAFSIGASDIYGYKLFQHGSSVIGLPVLLFLSWRWLAAQPANSTFQPLLSTGERCALLVVLFGVPCIAVAFKLGMAIKTPVTSVQLHNLLFYFVTGVGLRCLQLFSLYSVILVLIASQRSSSAVDVEASAG